jgi:ABC-type multidrug transport system fused ATPase/permease subunit
MRGIITPGLLVAFLGYVGIIFGPISNFSRVYISIQQSIAAVQRIFEILDIKADIEESPSAIDMVQTKGEIIFRNVCFSYNGDKTKVLDRVNLKIFAGETIALVGPSGVGKTTIVNLIFRFYDPQNGQILIDGVDIRRLTIDSLRKQIGLVPQEVVLFNTTIKENIAYGKLDASEEEIIQAAEIANAHKFIINLPEGYNTVVGDQGMNLSMGQRQRIAIARAVIKNPKILILDEPTSSLEGESEVEILEKIQNLMQYRTIIITITTHKLSIIKKCNRIMTIKDGRVVVLKNNLV